MSRSVRDVVLWLGPWPSEAVEREFKQRNLRLFDASADLQNRLPSARALVTACEPQLAVEYIRNHGHAVLDHGLVIWTLAADDAAAADLTARTRTLKGYVREPLTLRHRTAPPHHEIAEQVARHDPGPAEKSDLKVAWDNRIPDAEKGQQVVLLRRAFADCQEIYVRPLVHGNSARVFSIEAILFESRVGARPLPFFAKFDVRRKIMAERDNYRDFVAGFIPYGLRPNVDDTRSLFGATRGLLITNFVHPSVSLWDAAVRGDGPPAIHSLFHDGLYAWRCAAYGNQGTCGLKTMPLVADFKGDLDREVPAARLAVARAHGLRHDASKIRRALTELPAVAHRKCPMHGDLHVQNVRVRNNEATLIDFNSTRVGPLLADLASLDVSLSFTSFGNLANAADQHGWQAFVDELYRPSVLTETPPVLIAHGSAREWLLKCLRQIRTLALMGRTVLTEYETLIAFYLFRTATFHARDDDDDFRRAYALVLAERILFP